MSQLKSISSYLYSNRAQLTTDLLLLSVVLSALAHLLTGHLNVQQVITDLVAVYTGV